MMQNDALAPLRFSGSRVIAAFLWGNAAMIVPIGMLIDSVEHWTTLAMAVLLAILPTVHCLQGRTDGAARLASGLALTAYPMLFVYLFRDHPWQMDMHMHFFVCFSLMILTLDARPILVGAALTVTHHLLLYLVLPDWVFPGSGSIPRVLLHGFLVSCLVAVLLATIRLITRLTLTNTEARQDADAARLRAEGALANAEDAHQQTEGALTLSRKAEERAATEHRERLAAESALQKVGQERRHAIALQLEEGIGALIDDLLSVAENIAQHAGDIRSVSSALVEQANGLGASSTNAVSAVESVASNSDELIASIRSVGSHAESAQRVAMTTAASIATLEPGINKLTREVDTARDILAMVSEIASQSNLLALNASIEAARSGEAGRGFSVVAHEMKQMAGATARAVEDITVKLAGITGAASDFRQLIAASTGHAEDIKSSSLAIVAALSQQRHATDAISDGAKQMLAKAVDTDQRSRTLTAVAGDNSAIASSATVLSDQLGQRAEALRERMRMLIGELRAA